MKTLLRVSRIVKHQSFQHLPTVFQAFVKCVLTIRLDLIPVCRLETLLELTVLKGLLELSVIDAMVNTIMPR